jgi:hypothetical protein
MQVSNIVSSNQTVTNSATLVTVPELTISVGKYERVAFNYQIFYTTTASGDLKYRIDVPASPTSYRLLAEEQAPAGAATVTTILTAEADDSVLAVSGTDGYLNLKGVLVNGATAGDIVFQFAQNTQTASESAVILAGAYVEYRRF